MSRSSPAPLQERGSQHEEGEDVVLPWLRHLRHLLTFSHALVIGAGHGYGRWVRFISESGPSHVTLVEADAVLFRQLQKSTARHPDWLLCQNLIAPGPGPRRFHRSSIPAENGLMAPEDLRSVWPRISARESSILDAITLGELIRKPASPPDWIFIDCLPALPMITEASALLPDAALIVARTAEIHGCGDLSKEALVAAMEPFHFRLLAHQPCRNPSMGHALFIRDRHFYGKMADTLRARISELGESLDEAMVRLASQQSVIRNRFARWNQFNEDVIQLSQSLCEYVARDTTKDPGLRQTISQPELLEHILRDHRPDDESEESPACAIAKRLLIRVQSVSTEAQAIKSMTAADSLTHVTESSASPRTRDLIETKADLPSTLEELNRIWLDNLGKESVSQLGQDLWVLERTSYKRGGYFVEFGATDGISLSNTYLLEKRFGWQGICAEPNPKYFSQLAANRLCIACCECIGPVTGELVEFVFASEYGAMLRDIDKDSHRDIRQKYVETGQTGTLITISLHDFLVKHSAPRVIDYLSIDTEGSEYSILKVFPFDRWDIRHITVEHNFTEQRGMIRDLLVSHGYQFLEREWDDWYFRE